jgi:hypothetical protein
METGFLMGFMAGMAFVVSLITGNKRGLLDGPRMRLTRLLIRAAMKTCVMGFCHDHLTEALRYEADV